MSQNTPKTSLQQSVLEETSINCSDNDLSKQKNQSQSCADNPDTEFMIERLLTSLNESQEENLKLRTMKNQFLLTVSALEKQLNDLKEKAQSETIIFQFKLDQSNIEITKKRKTIENLTRQNSNFISEIKSLQHENQKIKVYFEKQKQQLQKTERLLNSEKEEKQQILHKCNNLENQLKQLKSLRQDFEFSKNDQTDSERSITIKLTNSRGSVDFFKEGSKIQEVKSGYIVKEGPYQNQNKLRQSRPTIYFNQQPYQQSQNNFGVSQRHNSREDIYHRFDDSSRIHPYVEEQFKVLKRDLQFYMNKVNQLQMYTQELKGQKNSEKQAFKKLILELEAKLTQRQNAILKLKDQAKLQDQHGDRFSRTQKYHPFQPSKTRRILYESSKQSPYDCPKTPTKQRQNNFSKYFQQDLQDKSLYDALWTEIHVLQSSLEVEKQKIKILENVNKELKKQLLEMIEQEDKLRKDLLRERTKNRSASISSNSSRISSLQKRNDQFKSRIHKQRQEFGDLEIDTSRTKIYGSTEQVPQLQDIKSQIGGKDYFPEATFNIGHIVLDEPLRTCEKVLRNQLNQGEEPSSSNQTNYFKSMKERKFNRKQTISRQEDNQSRKLYQNLLNNDDEMSIEHINQERKDKVINPENGNIKRQSYHIQILQSPGGQLMPEKKATIRVLNDANKAKLI